MPKLLLFNIDNKRKKKRENLAYVGRREEGKKEEMAAPMNAISHMTGKDH